MAGLKHALAKPMIVNNPNAFLDGRSGKLRRVSKKLKELIRLLLTGETTTITAACARVGLNTRYASRSLRMPHVRNYLDDQLCAALDEGKILATARLTELLRSDSDHVSLDATKLALAIGGIAPPTSNGISVNIQNNVAPGYVVTLPAEPVAAIEAPSLPHERRRNEP